MEQPNGHAHCMSMILGSAGESIPVGDGELCLGTWQRVLFIELDRSRPRRWLCKVVGSLARLASSSIATGADVRGTRFELEDPEVAARHVHGDVVDRHAVDLALERAVMRVAVHDEIRAVTTDRSRESVCAEHEPQAARARRRASPRPASSGAARCESRRGRSPRGSARGRRRRASSLRTPRERAARRSSPTPARSRRRIPSPPRCQRSLRDTGRIVCDRSSITTPASASARCRSSGRSDCQSWFPSTATTGTSSPRHASATTHTSSTCPCCVRSPASRTRSACVADTVEHLAHAVAVRRTGVDVSGRRNTNRRRHASVHTPGLADAFRGNRTRPCLATSSSNRSSVR